MNKVILDSSALITFIKNENGGNGGGVVMSTLNISEAAEILVNLGMT